MYRSCDVAIWLAYWNRYHWTGARRTTQNVSTSCTPTLVVVGLAMAGNFAVKQLLGFPFVDAALAFMPGGFQVMPVVALEAGADGLYFTTHHLIRVLAMGVCIPLFVSYWSRS
ncbi:MAG: hypothetical protein CMQ84_02040 [Gammaproteobacteria bacterium]|nr:hypothetical protein [Gammaproteobacteria bacterium]OUX79600.1 MAG: hypothetical protein CBC19_02450 [Oceanospirillales bacterium TMED59]